MSETPLTGGCNCGAVKFELTEAPVYAYYCHCTRCQKRSGAGAAPGAVVAPGSFNLLRGEEDLRKWSAGDGFDKWFCGTCGSHLYAQSPENPELVSVRLGAFDSDPGVRPTGRHFTNYAATWEPIDPDDGLTHHPEELGSGS